MEDSDIDADVGAAMVQLLKVLPALLTCLVFLFFWGAAIHYTYTYMQRKKPQVSNERSFTAEAASYPCYLGKGRRSFTTYRQV